PGGQDALAEVVASLEPQPLGGNRPLVLTEDAGAVATRGSLVLFLRDATTARAGRRHFVATVPAGTLVWVEGAATPEGWELIAVGGPETTVVVVPAERLRGEALADVVADHRARVARAAA